MAKKKILIVEDEVIIAADLKDLLESNGYEVLGHASTADHAVKMALEMKPDIILMDIVLQGVRDGIQAAKEIREKENIPIIFVSAFSDSELLVKANMIEPYGYVLKPFQERQLIVSIEITLSKNQTEEKLRSMEKQLAKTDKMAVIGEIAGGVAHELNNPMAVIAGYTDALLQELTPLLENQSENSKQRLRSMLKKINDSVYYCKGVIQKLVNFTQLQMAESSAEKFDVNQIIVDVMRQLEYHKKKKDHIILELSPELPRVKGSSLLFNLAFSNLLSNAIDATESNDGKITVKSWKDSQFIYVLFSDTGCGIKDEHKKNIFAPFFTTKYSGKGLGLGLPITQSILNRVSGKIEFESHVGAGSKFTVQLPMT